MYIQSKRVQSEHGATRGEGGKESRFGVTE
jgi:hypothetical protein